MVFAAELDDVRQQIRRGAAAASNQVTFWPSIAGSGNVSISGTATYEIFKDSDSAIASGSMTETVVDSVSKLTVGVDASDTAIYTLAENYALVVTWTNSGVTYVSTVRFDCVLEPVTDLNVTLNDLIEEVADMAERLTRQGAAQASGRTAEQVASLLAVKGWGDVRRWLKATSEASGEIVPRLIVDREALRRVVVARAVARAYRAEGGGLDSESRQLYEDWDDESQTRFRELGPLSYDSSSDRVVDSKIGGFAVVATRRVF